MGKIIGIYGDSGAGKDLTSRLIQYVMLSKSTYLKYTSEFSDIDLDELTSVDSLFRSNSELALNNLSSWSLGKFSSAPKKMVANLLSVEPEKMEDREFKETFLPQYNCKVIDLIIKVSQGMKDIIGDDVWANVFWDNYKGEDLIITDLRFPYEYQSIKERGGKVIKLNAPGTNKKAMDGLLDSYTFDYHIFNMKENVHDLYVTVSNMIEYLYPAKQEIHNN